MRNTERYYEEKATYRMENYNSVDYIVQVTMDIDFEEARMWGDDETLLAECYTVHLCLGCEGPGIAVLCSVASRNLIILSFPRIRTPR